MHTLPREAGGLNSDFLITLHSPNSNLMVSAPHEMFCSRASPLAAPLPCASISSGSRSSSPPPLQAHPLLYPSPQFRQVLHGDLQAAEARGAGGLLKIYTCIPPKLNPRLIFSSIGACGLSSLSSLIPRGLSRS